MNSATQLLMRQHGRAVYRYCRAALRDTALADDVHQQVFIQVHRDLPKFEHRSAVRTWVFSIARHRIADATKWRRRAESRIGSDDATGVADPRPSAGENIDDERLRAALITCVDRLRPKERNAVLLRFQQGFTFEEMSQVCHEKPGTLQAKVKRALPKLRECIEECTGGSL